MKSTELIEDWQKYLVGQNKVMETIIPFINRYRSNLHMPRRTVGNFFLTGPTGTGKTRTPEVLAKVLHGSDRNLVHVNCELFQLEHEIAKLVGAPPGYLGHRETVPILSQTKINAAASPDCDLSIIVFDEIEKACSSMWRLMLGILDKAELKLGDNSTVNFEKCLIFMTSNKGSDQITKDLYSGFGFDIKPVFESLSEKDHMRIQSIGKKNVESGFTPEFFNRIDDTISYTPLTTENLKAITVLELNSISDHIKDRLKEKCFYLSYDQDVIDTMARLGTNVKYGARFLKRTIDKMIFNPLCNDFLDEKIQPNSTVVLTTENDNIYWTVNMPKLELDTEKPKKKKDISKSEFGAYIYESGATGAR